MKNYYLLFLSLLASNFMSAAVLSESSFLTVPTMPTLSNIAVCDSDNDGFSVFDLSVQNGVIFSVQGSAASNFTITYHEDITGAQTGSSPISGVTAYYNFSPNSQTIYVRVMDINTSEYSVGSFVLVVNNRPFITNLPSINFCDIDSNPNNGTTAINLSIQTLVVLSQQPLPSSNYTVTYFTTQVNAQAGVPPIINSSNYVATNGQTIWVRVENITTGCYGVGSFGVVVNSPLLVTTPLPINVCDDYGIVNDQYASFDLTIRSATITQGLAGYTVVFYPSLSHAQNNQMEITNPTNYVNVVSAIQTVGVKIITPQGCVSFTTLNIRVLPVPMTNINPPILSAQCENTIGSGQAIIDLTINESFLLNGNPNIVFHYFNNQEDLTNNVNEILNPDAALVGEPGIAGTTINYVQYVYIAVSGTQNIDYMNRPCYVIVSQGFIINALPQTLQPNYPLFSLCNFSSPNSGFETFNLASQIPNILLGQTGMMVEFYPSLLDAQNGTNVITNLQYQNTTIYVQTIGIRVVNASTGCYAISTMDIRVMPVPNLNLISSNTLNTLYVDGSNNVVQPLLLDTQLDGNYSFQWQVDGVIIPNAINSTYLVNNASLNNVSRVYTVTAQDFNTGCSSIETIVIEQSSGVPAPTGNSLQSFTSGATLADLVANGVNIQWYSSATGTVPLPLTTLLVDGVTYYATQTENNVESAARLVVTVQVSLGLNENEVLSLSYSPNPVENLLTLQSNETLKSIEVYNLLGQKVFEQFLNGFQFAVDLSEIRTGYYLATIKGDKGQKVVRILKR